jgi:radical SAM superfamily enzyme YgiQ (UPF0313 family)
MKILLINPPYSAVDRYGKDMAQFGPTTEPLGLAYLAGMLEAHGHEVIIWDGNVEHPFCSIPQRLRMDRQAYRIWGKPDVIGITMLTPAYDSAKAMIQLMRKRHPYAAIIVGGAHPTALSRETVKDIPEIDHVIRGDGEYKLLSYVERKGDLMNFDGPSTNLDHLPLPARHLLPMDRYRMTRSRTQGEHVYTVIVARGCPFRCGFCSRIHGKAVRFHSVDRVLQEVELLIRDYGATEINFEADTITSNKRFIIDLCDALIQTGLSKKIRWTCESRIDTVSAGMLGQMKEAGCWQISYGVETGSQRLLNLIQKGTRIEDIETAFKMTKMVGISIRAFYMLGLPTETAEETQQTIDFAKKLDADWSQFTLYTPFPGTALWDLAQQESPISKNWSDFRTHAGWTDHKPAWVPKGRTAQEMKAAQKRAYRSVYLRPRAMYGFAKKIRSYAMLRTLAGGFWTVLKTLKPQKTLVRVAKRDLSAYAKDNYVDSPVYFDAIWPVRELNWRKLGALLAMTNGEKKLLSGTALDLACGNGVLLPSLSRMFNRVIGIDLHPEAAQELVASQGLRNVEVLEGNAYYLYYLPILQESVDVVFATSCLEHFQHLGNAVSELKRVLKPNGKIFYLSPTENNLYRLGRAMLGYTKPSDHYWSGQEIHENLDCNFNTEKAKGYPAFMPIYTMGKYAKKAQQKSA